MAIPSTGYDSATISNPSSALTDFTLMIDLSRMSASFKSAWNTDDNGRGRACKSDGTTELACDWIDLDNSAGTGWLRVKYTGSLASSGTQVIRIFPPTTTNTQYSASDTYGSDNAYDANWEGYWTLEEDPSGAAPQIIDRTSNSRDGTTVGSMTSGDLVSAQVENGLDFDGINDGVGMGAIALLGIGSSFTFSAWVSPTAQTEHDGTCQVICGDGSSNRNWQWRVTAGVVQLIRFNTGNGVIETVAGSTDMRSQGWQHMVARFDTTNGTELFLDDTSEATSSNTTVNNDNNSLVALGINDRDDNERWDGLMDECQIHSTARTDAWIAEEYAQTNDNATFWGTWTWSGSSGGIVMPILSDNGIHSVIFGGQICT